MKRQISASRIAITGSAESKSQKLVVLVDEPQWAWTVGAVLDQVLVCSAAHVKGLGSFRCLLKAKAGAIMNPEFSGFPDFDLC